MPRTLNEHDCGDGFVVKLRQRLPGESYVTEYSIQTFEHGEVRWLGDCQGFGDDREYAERKFAAVVENVTLLLGADA